MENKIAIQKNRGGRNKSIDFLRILCMFGIVWLHAGTFGYYSYDVKPNIWVIHFKYMLAVCVDIFAFISGWYGVKFTLNKFIRIILLSLFCGTIAFLISHYIFNCAPLDWKVFVHYCVSNWYFVGYLVLMLICPIINAGLEKFEEEKFKSLVLPLLLLCIWQFVASILSESSSIGTATGLGRAYFSRYSFMTLVNIYIVGRIFRKTNLLEKIKTWHLLLVGVISALFTTFPPLHYYTSPFCIVEAICIFEIFKRLSIPDWLGNIGIFLAPSMFSILLLHREDNFCKAIFIPLEGKVLGSLNPFISVFIAAFVVFNVCLLTDLTRRLFLFMLKRTYLSIKDGKGAKNGWNYTFK